MRSLPNLVPQTLVGRVFALYAVSLALFVGVGLGFFYYYTFVVELEDAADSAQILSEVDSGRFGNAFAYCTILIAIVLGVIGAMNFLIRDRTPRARVQQ